jgi:hypothetical protein
MGPCAMPDPTAARAGCALLEIGATAETPTANTRAAMSH